MTGKPLARCQVHNVVVSITALSNYQKCSNLQQQILVSVFAWDRSPGRAWLQLCSLLRVSQTKIEVLTALILLCSLLERIHCLAHSAGWQNIQFPVALALRSPFPYWLWAGPHSAPRPHQYSFSPFLLQAATMLLGVLLRAPCLLSLLCLRARVIGPTWIIHNNFLILRSTD